MDHAKKLLEDKALILAASRYRSAADSCNSVYLGSMATAKLFHVLGGDWGRNGLADVIKAASRAQVDEALKVCASVIEYMGKHPTTECPCCGGVVSVNRLAEWEAEHGDCS